MTLVLQIISFLISEEPEIQKGVLDIVQIFKDVRDKKITAQQALDQANAAVGLLLGRLADPAAESAGVDGAADQALRDKFKP